MIIAGEHVSTIAVNKYLCIASTSVSMALFSQKVVYRSPHAPAVVLEQVANSIEKKMTVLEFWSEPARFYRGKIDGNSFRLRTFGRNPQTFIVGSVEEVEDGSVITVKIYAPKHNRKFLTALATLISLCVLYLVIYHKYEELFFAAIVIAIVAAIAFPLSVLLFTINNNMNQ